MEQTEVIMLAPEELAVVSNVRFGLKKYRVDSLADAIKEFGEVHTPLKVEPLEETEQGGPAYAIREGHYRHAAVVKLNKEGAGLKLPCIVEDPTEKVARVRYQISENLDRENLSPMDTAVAIKELADLGVPKPEIRNIFQRVGGRKGLTMQPLSNAMLNIYLSFLEFPKKVQGLIHDGILPVGMAYRLTTKPKELWQPIIDQAEADRLKEIEADEKLEERYLSEQKKLADAEAKEKADREAATNAQKIADEAAKTAEERKQAAAAAYQAAQSAKGKDAKKKAEEVFKAKEAEAKTADKAAEDAKATAEKMTKRLDEQAEKAAQRRKQLEEARAKAVKEASKKKLDTDKAAAKVESGHVRLKGPEMYKSVYELATLPGLGPKAQSVAKAFLRHFDGATTDTQLVAELSWAVGERKQKPDSLKLN